MAAALMRQEELAITLKFTVVIGDMVTVVIPMESKVEFVEAKALMFLGVALRLLDLAYHSIIHFQSPFIGEIKRHARGRMPQMI
jgi:hypothetical protein